MELNVRSRQSVSHRYRKPASSSGRCTYTPCDTPRNSASTDTITRGGRTRERIPRWIQDFCFVIETSGDAPGRDLYPPQVLYWRSTSLVNAYCMLKRPHIMCGNTQACYSLCNCGCMRLHLHDLSTSVSDGEQIVMIIQSGRHFML